ncbi:unnamed protein product [Euphydryas editha]|uniref:DUF4817 domain-containing protein n=2 Tax=Euphydryas editha TaxID=104508 RepID=A0AAU9TI33_EUPED|nr:unnamed protein product [Euphydryas editha]
MAAVTPRRRGGSQQSFTNAEYTDILFVYGFCDGDSAKARAEYIRRFPNRRPPNVRVFSNTYRRMHKTGTVQRRQHDAGRPRLYAPEDEEEILSHFSEDPTISTNIVANRLGISQWKVWFTVHSNGLYPYHFTPVHVLHEGDPIRRVDFCRFMLHRDAEDPYFLKRILWTDESKFDQDGITNYHNIHYWAPKVDGNPNKKKETGSQRRFGLNVWMGIVDDCLIGPHFLPNMLNSENYENFLREELYSLLEDVPLQTRQKMIYQHDGCPAHFRRSVRQWLDESFPNRWIGRGGPIPWPARCPDITPVDFYVWGHMKALVYDNLTGPISSQEVLRQRIIDAASIMRNNLTSRVTKTEIRRRCRKCIRNRGAQFEQH